jgi:NitT/TauT family transport system substrate-binding protein
VVSKANNLSRAARASATAVEWVEMQFPDMPAALYVGAVAAYATGEPFGTVAEAGTINRPIPYEKDVDESFIQNV